MHATLLTLVLAVGAQPPGTSTEPLAISTTVEGCKRETSFQQHECETSCQQCGCVQAACQCGGEDKRHCCVAWLGPMPQTCYAPRFGCYPGNNRHMHRYPAFHGYYYRQPYNYRHLFDYPWHATPHEPQPLYGYRAAVVPSDEPIPAPIPQRAPAAP